MENAKVLRFSQTVFGFFAGTIQKIFEDSDFKKNGVTIVEPPVGFFNSDRFSSHYEEIIANVIVHKKMEPITVNNKKIGIYNLIPDGDVESMTIGEFLKKSPPEMVSLEGINNVDDFEKIFWTNPETRRQIYAFKFGKNQKIFKKSFNSWNPGFLGDILQSIRENEGTNSQGVTESSIIIGQIGSTFAIHTEDFNLPALNYLHSGAPKIWYTIAPEDYERFRNLILSDFKKSEFTTDNCENYLAHKNLICSPEWLKKNKIKYTRVRKIIIHQTSFNNNT